MANERVLKGGRSPSPYIDLSRQVLLPAGTLVEAQDELRVRQLVLQGRSNAPFPGDEPGLYDTITFAKTYTLPGIAKVRGKAFSQKLQKDSPPGTHGSSVKQLGCKPARIEVRLQLWTREHWEAFERLIPILKSQRYETKDTTEEVTLFGLVGETGTTASVAGRRRVAVGPAPIDVYHPLLALFKIRTVHILEVSFPEAGRGGGDVWEVEIDCEEYVPASSRSSAVKKADSSMEIIRTNPLVGSTAADIALESKGQPTTKPSDYVRDPGFGD